MSKRFHFTQKSFCVRPVTAKSRFTKMEIRLCWLLSLLMWKLVIASGIIIFLLTSIDIYRHELVSKNKVVQMSFKSFRFQAVHHLCSKPKDTTNTSRMEDILNSLDLPKGTEMSQTLMGFGNCRAKTSKFRLESDPCMCNRNPGYIILICVCFVSILIGLSQLLGARMYDGYEASFAFFGSLAWMITLCIATVYHIDWYDEVWLPDTLFAQNYFRKPTKWTTVIIFATIYFCFSFIEFLCLDPMRYADVDDYHYNGHHARCRSYKIALRRIIVFTEIRMRRFNICNADAWSVQSEPNDVKERYYVGRHTSRSKPFFNKTYP